MPEIHGRNQGNDDHVVCDRVGYHKSYDARCTATIPTKSHIQYNRLDQYGDKMIKPSIEEIALERP